MTATVRDEAPLERWFRHEMAGLTQSLVRIQRPLTDLVNRTKPSAETRGGDTYWFDADALARLSAALRPLTAHGLRLPIFFYVDREAPGNAFVSDTPAMHALVELRVAARAPEEGRLWVGLPLAQDFARRYPTTCQFVHL